MTASDARPRSFIGVFCCICIGIATAMPSSDCMSYVNGASVLSSRRRLSSCRRPICGSLDNEDSYSTFMDRLSPTCQAAMSKYSDPSMSRRFKTRAQLYYTDFFSSLRPPRTESSIESRHCSSSTEASFASNPVVVERPDTSNFITCTVPKAGCTLLRSLLYMLTRVTDKPLSFHSSYVHTAKYPTTWHYHARTAFSDAYPTFVIGRNPYIRLVSGFLDKMVISEVGHDWVIMQRVNQDLGRPKDEGFEPTFEAFKEFVVMLSGASHRNQHFDTAVNVCEMTQFPYRYMLKIEEMSEWYPCWVEGLKLNNLVWSGWERSPDGETLYRNGLRECWWKPEGTTCDIYYDKTHSSEGAIVPDSWEAGPTLHGGDRHDTASASRWLEFYDRETADLVYEIYKDDFLAFGYDKLVFDETGVLASGA